MILTYQKEGQTIGTREPNEDVSWSDHSEGNRRTVTVTAQRAVTLLSCELGLEHSFAAQDRIFANGYQSWTQTEEFAAGEHLNDLSKLPKRLVEAYAFPAYGSQAFRPMPKKVLTAFDVAYVAGSDPLFIGNRNYRRAYLILELDRGAGEIRLISDVAGKELQPGESFIVLDYQVWKNVEEGEAAYWSSFRPRCEQKLFGYTSWYHHYQNINEEILAHAFANADERFELFQIDDGFERYVGDWLEPDRDKFPHGLEPIVEQIHAKGMLAGIWLAPFAAERDSELVKNHPDWIHQTLAGSNWSGFYPLNLDRPEAVDYVRRVLRRYVDMGFDFFKLDFLYAANLIPRKGMTRSETAEFAYGLLRECLGEDKRILGCGATLANGFERFDYMRIGPDVSLKFDDQPYMRLFHPERISTKVTLMNTIYRSPMNGRVFLNDPDVFLLRDENMKLSREQRYALAKINALFGSLLMTSDNPREYDAEKKAILDEVLHIFRSNPKPRYQREDARIRVRYELDQAEHSFEYHTKKGVICDER